MPGQEEIFCSRTVKVSQHFILIMQTIRHNRHLDIVEFKDSISHTQSHIRPFKMRATGLYRQSISTIRLSGRRDGTNHVSQIPKLQTINHTRNLHSTRLVQLSSKTIKDPNHPDGLYYHPLKESNQYAISFLSQPPSTPTSSSIIGFIKDQPESNPDEIFEIAVRNPDLVKTHAPFVKLMHEVLKSDGVPQDGLLEYEAYLRTEGFAHVNDQRHQLMPGRIATPENIIATVAFTDSKIHPDTYEPNDVYRIVTAEEGFLQLRPNWLDLIVKKCRQHN